MSPDVDAYARFRAMGAVLDVARLPIPTGDRHEAVVRAMRIFSERYDARLAALNPGRDVSGYFHITIEPEVESGRRALVGRQITIGELLGPGYDLDADEVRLFRYSENARSCCVFEGLAHALLDPPYPLRNPDRPTYGAFGSIEHGRRESAWMRDVLRAFCAEVLVLDDPKHAPHLVVHEWPTDWSSYFDAGKEWWGAFLWTIEDSRHGWATVVGASSTD